MRWSGRARSPARVDSDPGRRSGRACPRPRELARHVHLVAALKLLRPNGVLQARDLLQSMPTKTQQKRNRKLRSRSVAAVTSAATGASWMALLAATTLGVGYFDRVRARVSSDVELAFEDSGEGYRLIVQSYDASALTDGALPDSRVRPLGSVQRAITAEELKNGVAVDVVQLAEQAPIDHQAPVVVAWIERGEPDLEFDAMRARPAPGAHYGSVRTSSAQARLVLTG